MRLLRKKPACCRSSSTPINWPLCALHVQRVMHASPVSDLYLKSGNASWPNRGIDTHKYHLTHTGEEEKRDMQLFSQLKISPRGKTERSDDATATCVPLADRVGGDLLLRSTWVRLILFYKHLEDSYSFPLTVKSTGE
jgi:hypothetical protein